MIIKKSVRCRKCREWITIYAEQRMPYLGMTLKCNCGHKQKCVKENIHTTKWEDVEMSKLGALAPKSERPIKKKKRSNCKKTVFLKCQECGKYYEVPSYDKNKRKYCSRTCGSRAFNRTRQIYELKTVNCLCCGDEFTFKSYPTKKDQRFCCTDCANRFNRAREYEERRAKLMEEIERDYNELMCNV